MSCACHGGNCFYEEDKISKTRRKLAFVSMLLCNDILPADIKLESNKIFYISF